MPQILRSFRALASELLKAGTIKVIGSLTQEHERHQLLQFKQRIEETARNKKTDIVLALDFPYQNPQNRNELLAKALAVLEAVHPYVCALKINHHLVLPLGTFDGVQTLVNQAHDQGLQVIIDCKANDIGNTNRTIAEYYFEAGFDALIANPFVGWQEGLKPIFTAAGQQNRGVILLTYMSHKGATEGYGQIVIDPQTSKPIAQYLAFAQRVLKWKADGAIVGATMPKKIREIHGVLGRRVPIYSPGVGAQGGNAETARKAGARYLIVGREITMANDPAVVAKRMASMQEQ